MLLCTGFIVVIAVAFSVYVGFSNLAKVVEMEGTLKARKFSNVFHDEAPVDELSIFTRSDPMWFSSYYNSISTYNEGKCSLWDPQNCPHAFHDTKETLEYYPTDLENAVYYASLVAEAALEKGTPNECKFDRTSTLEYGVAASAIISKEAHMIPGLSQCVTNVVYDLAIDPRYIDIYISPDLSLCPQNMREMDRHLKSLTHCSVQVRWFIDFGGMVLYNSYL